MSRQSTTGLAALLLSGAALTGCVTPAEQEQCPASEDWQAWVNAMPGPGTSRSLIVTGQVYLAKGTTAKLEPGISDRMLPPGQQFVLQLSADADAPGGWQPIRGTLKPALESYREVTIRCGEGSLARIQPVTTAY
ncbi:hypothetical protein [Altericroceibacterium endophyticum]|uniref:Uncharacterized protein n=1 Tax=Altericroceibacterium endophyticum TaxID=1808508 RepID=A0A6I4T4S5_9SPHN|nr:hypothetical protein [Altericroceibacterium endophyticum]MXO65886.1 hypothetical protein [Altericroceibacterium endophyticum]